MQNKHGITQSGSKNPLTGGQTISVTSKEDKTAAVGISGQDKNDNVNEYTELLKVSYCVKKLNEYIIKPIKKLPCQICLNFVDLDSLTIGYSY